MSDRSGEFAPQKDSACTPAGKSRADWANQPIRTANHIWRADMSIAGAESISQNGRLACRKQSIEWDNSGPRDAWSPGRHDAGPGPSETYCGQLK
jgi:hypothetical protein